MNTTTHRRAIRFYSHLLKVCGYANTPELGIVHYANPKGCSELWCEGGSCLIDRSPQEIFIDKGLDIHSARTMLVSMCKAAIARVEHLN